ncbi:MAG: copper chaperone PCu(A)C [Rhodobacter sp.]|nr:copper chaperone PCu(A)C [Rhodobacter sp.]
MLSRRFLLAAAAALTLAPATLVAATAAVAEDHPETYHVHEPYARSMGSVGASGAVFMVLHNNGSTDDRPDRREIRRGPRSWSCTHTMTADGVMQMHEIRAACRCPRARCTASCAVPTTSC